MDDYWEDGYWREGYWGLFWETGAPEFYLLRRGGASAETGETDATGADAAEESGATARTAETVTTGMTATTNNDIFPPCAMPEPALRRGIVYMPVRGKHRAGRSFASYRKPRPAGTLSAEDRDGFGDRLGGDASGGRPEEHEHQLSSQHIVEDLPVLGPYFRKVGELQAKCVVAVDQIPVEYVQGGGLPVGGFDQGCRLEARRVNEGHGSRPVIEGDNHVSGTDGRLIQNISVGLHNDVLLISVRVLDRQCQGAGETAGALRGIGGNIGDDAGNGCVLAHEKLLNRFSCYGIRRLRPMSRKEKKLRWKIAEDCAILIRPDYDRGVKI